MAATEPIREKRHADALMAHFLAHGEIRNYVLVVLGIHTALRIGDLLGLTWDDLYDFDRKRIITNITVTEQKTNKTKTVALNAKVVKALNRYVHTAERGKPVIVNKYTGKAISRVQAYRILRMAA